MAEKENNLRNVAETPLMRQYFKMKQLHPDAILLFRVGDFYETFVEDAIETARILGITLTKRANGKAEHIELAGFPHHALETYLPRLVRAGKRVAICDQLEDPKQAKTIVKRGITEVVTPGVALSDNILENKTNNYLAALSVGKNDIYGLALLDISTGQFYATEGPRTFIHKMIDAHSPKELIVQGDLLPSIQKDFQLQCFIYTADDWYFTPSNNRERLLRHFRTRSLKGFGLDGYPLATTAAGAILNYLDVTRHGSLGHISSISRINEGAFVRLDSFTIFSLELVEPMNRGGKTLKDILDKTSSPMGARLLHNWILMPLKEVAAIRQRHAIVKALQENPHIQRIITSPKEGLPAMGDLERTAAKVAMRRINPAQMVALGYALAALKPIKEALLEDKNPELQALGHQLALCEELHQRIQYQMNPNAPSIISKGDVIAKGYNEELDELRSLAQNGQQYLLNLQRNEAERTGITSLKVGFNNVFGYYLEVRNTHKKLVPAEWIRKQTLVSAERYITEELKAFESKILGAQERIATIENQLFEELVSYSQQFVEELQRNCRLLAKIDVLHSFAVVARQNGYTCPEVDDSYTIDIVEGRHPVIERQMRDGESYIPNSVKLNNDQEQILTITGPNMSGKSALLRQVALISLMAQIGSFVPAEQATIGIVDAIFTRVGASDNISMGESTFMVEMQEAANILNNLTERSLILLDEIGRGTGTFDGMSIAWSIVEYLHNHQKLHPKTLFATHYHELNELAQLLPRVRNFNVSAKEVNGEMIFLRKLEEGGNEQSFGIQVAKIAGMPLSIIRRAQEILDALEKERSKEGLGLNPIDHIPGVNKSRKKLKNKYEQSVQVSLFDISDPALTAIRDELQVTDINTLTPIEALNKLSRLKAILNKY